jgi:hypothetical protein
MLSFRKLHDSKEKKKGLLARPSLIVHMKLVVVLSGLRRILRLGSGSTQNVFFDQLAMSAMILKADGH